MNKATLAFVVTLLLSVLASAQPIKVLFVGNSFTYEPGEVSNPALPENFKAIATALQADVQVEAIVKGGQTMKRHFDEGEVAKKLQSTKYDFVILQAQSIEPLELPKCFPDNGGPIGRAEFVEYSKKLIALIQDSGATPVVFAHWTYKKDHAWLQDNFPCLKFASNEVHAGKNWFGANLTEYQSLLNEGFALAQGGSSTVILSKVGSQWQALMDSKMGSVPDAVLYQEDNFHPTTAGSFYSAMVLARDVLNIDLNPLSKHPTDVTEAQFQAMKSVLAVP